MKILNFGSLNIDYSYHVSHIVKPGETLSAHTLIKHCGGKGLNQSVAIVHAGGEVYHAGYIGKDGKMLLDLCQQTGIFTQHIRIDESMPTGHAVIQVSKTGQNSIIVHGGANLCLSEAYIDGVLSHFQKGDILLLQNEINLVDYIIRNAYARGMHIYYNPAPYSDDVKNYPLSLLECLIVNETEGQHLAETEETGAGIIEKLGEKYSQIDILLTMGARGCILRHEGKNISVSAFTVDTVDTTAAGDTFIGYFLHGLATQKKVQKSLSCAAAASAICVSRFGAAETIPKKEEVEVFLRERNCDYAASNY